MLQKNHQREQWIWKFIRQQLPQPSNDDDDPRESLFIVVANFNTTLNSVNVFLSSDSYNVGWIFMISLLYTLSISTLR